MTKPGGSAASWSHYWQSGQGRTCYSGSEAFSLDTLWKDFFSSLAPKSHVLDLATGNGAVALVAAEVSKTQDLGFEVTGLDQATITATGSQFPGLEFISNTDMADTGIKTGSMDAVTSQYGFEYADHRLTVPEISRVCRGGAQLFLIIHARHGAIDVATRQRLERTKLILGSGQLMELARQLTKAMMEKPAPATAKLAKLEKKFQARLKAAGRRLQDASPDDAGRYAAQYLAELIAKRSRYAPEEMMASLDSLREELQHYVIRTNGMLRAAKTHEQMAALIAAFESAGFGQLTCNPISDHRHQVAWNLAGTLLN